MRTAPQISAFNAGELSPLMDGQINFEKYASGLKTMQNFIPLVQGPATKRPGIQFVGSNKFKSKRAALIPFRPSKAQNYVIELGHLYMRFFTNHGQLLVESPASWSGATNYVVGNFVSQSGKTWYCIQNNINILPGSSGASPYWIEQNQLEIPTPWSESDLFDNAGILQLDFVLSNDVMYLVHAKHAPRKLIRQTSTTFSLEIFEFTGGPFDRVNKTSTAVYASSQTGTVNLASSAPLFNADMVGSLFMLQEAEILDIPPWQASTDIKKNDRRRNDNKNYEAFVNGGTDFDAKSISHVSISNPIEITTAVNHGLINGNRVLVGSVGGTTEINDLAFDVTASAANVLRLNGINGTGFGAYTSGGNIQKVVPTGQTGPTHTIGERTDGKVAWTYRDDGTGIIKITAFTDSQNVTGTVINRIPAGAVGSGNQSKRFAKSLFSNESGWPSNVCFWRERLVFAGNQKIALSVTSDFENFAGYDFGEVLPESAIVIILNADQGNEIQYISEIDDLLVGTEGALFSLTEISSSQPIGPTNIRQRRSGSNFGNNRVKPVLIGNSLMAMQKSGRKLRAYQYDDRVQNFHGVDMTVLAEHITESGVIQMAFTQEPDSILWCVRADGVLIGFTFDQEQNVLAWHRHPMQNGLVESICAISNPGGYADEAWMIVRRVIDGEERRYIEFLHQRSVSDLSENWYLDSALHLKNQPINIAGISKTNPLVISALSHGFSDGQSVFLYTGIAFLDKRHFVVANSTTDSFEILDAANILVDGTNLPDYLGDGTAVRVVNTVQGLDHLEGETVAAIVNGSVHPPVQVENSSVNLSLFGSDILIGYKIESILQTTRLEAGSLNGVSQGKTKRFSKIRFRLMKSMGGSAGSNPENLEEILWIDSPEDFDTPPELFTGDKTVSPWPFGYETDGSVMIFHDAPLPFTLIAIYPLWEVMES